MCDTNIFLDVLINNPESVYNKLRVQHTKQLY